MPRANKVWAWQSYSDKNSGRLNQGAGRDLYEDNIANDAILCRELGYYAEVNYADNFACCPLNPNVLENNRGYIELGCLDTGMTVYSTAEDTTEYSFANRRGLPDEVSRDYYPVIGVCYRDETNKC